MTPAEALTASFYAWELRGRGWLLADYPVSLEPPYRPCFMLPGLRSRPQPIDDGKRPTFLSSLVEGAKELLTAKSEPHQEEGLFEEEPPFPELPRGMQTTLGVRLPEGHDTTLEATQRMLRTLLSAIEPLSFELIGHNGSVQLQICCGDSDAEHVAEAITGYAPEVSVIPSEDHLAQSWDAGAPSFVVDFGLTQEFFLPLGTLRSFRVDPYISLVSALAQTKKDETLCFQVLMERVANPWTKSILDAVLDGSGGSIIADAPEFLPLAREKVSSPLYAAVVRIAAQARTLERAWELTRGTSSFFLQHATPGSNELLPLENDGYPDEAHEAAILTRRSFRTGMLLSLDELVGLVHLPDASVRHEALVRERKRTKALPLEAKGHALVLGVHDHRGEREVATLAAERRLEHTHLIGASGTGKSTLLVNLITQDLAKGEGLAVLDPHGDLIDDILGRIPRERTDHVVVFDPGDMQHPIGFNILSAQSETEKNLIASDMVGIFQRFATSWGDAMSTVLGNAVLAILEHPDGGTLLTLRRLLVDDAFRAQYLKGVSDREVRFFWEKEFRLIGTRSIGPILTRLNTFLRPKLIRHIVAQKKPRLDLAEVMNSGKVFLAKLSQGVIGEENAYLLGSLLASKLHQLALSRQSLPKENRRPFFVYADEFQHFVTPSMGSLLTEARKYGVGLILAHQTLAQLREAPKVQEALLGNAYTRIVFRVGDDDARKLADGFSFFRADDIRCLGRGEAIVRMGASSNDFNLKTVPTSSIDSAYVDARRTEVISSSRGMFATPLAEVETTLSALFDEPEADERTERVPAEIVQRTVPQKGMSPEKSIRPEVTVTHRPETPKPARRLDVDLEPPPMGRGGQQHKYLQQLVKRLAEERGFRTTIEDAASDGRADVVLRKGKLSIACEISITTSAEHEVENLRKCIGAGFTRIFFISASKRRRDAVEKRMRDVDVRASIDYMNPEDICAALDNIIGESELPDTTVRGYKVKVTRQSVSPADVAERRSAVAGVIARSLRQSKR